MLQTVGSSKTLLIHGAACVRLVSGGADVFGLQVKAPQKVVVREGKRLSFFVPESAVFDLSLGVNAGVEEVEGSTIPDSWSTPIEAILGVQAKPVVIVVLGKSDSGKSSYCAYLVNKLVDGRCRVAVLDGDLGQSDIGASGTIGYAVASRQVAELYDLKLENAFFVGVTSPIKSLARTIEGLVILKTEVLQRPVDYLIVNTDGFVEGAIAVQYKAALVKELKPDVLVGVKVKDELDGLIASIQQPVLTVDASSLLSPRTAESRRNLREMTYVRYLKDSKLQCFPISQLTVEPRGALPMNQSPDKGLLVGLYDARGKFLGIGVLREINWARRVLKIQTSVSAKPWRLVLGQVFLDTKLREVLD